MGTATVYSGTIGYGTGKDGQALTSGVLSAPVTASSDFTWTIEAWVKAPSSLPSTDIAYLSWGAAGSWVGMTADGNGRTNSGPTGYAFPRDGAWHHVAIVAQGDGRMEHWVDGQFTNEFLGATSDSTLSTVYIGGRQAAGHEWGGGVDEVRYTAGQRYSPYNNFTVPSAPLSADTKTLSLWHLNGDGTDSVAGSGGSTGGSSGGSTGGGSTGGSTGGSGTYTSSNDLFAIPERGWWLYTDTQLNGSGQTNPLDTSAMISARTSTRVVNGKSIIGSTLVFRYYFLTNYAYTDTIAQADLDAIASDLVKARNAGVKLVIRFAYSKDNSDDAPVARAVKQINQLAPVLNAGADVIHCLQAGFVGRWGEWYYSNNYGNENSVSDQNWTDRLTILNRLVTQLDSRIFIQVRYVGIRQRYLNSTVPNPGGNGPRIGLHNDAFTASYADYGTYTTFSTQAESANRDYLAGMTAVPVGGESESSGDGSWNAAQPQLDRYNWSYINPNYNNDVWGQWSQANWDTVTRQIGHRLRLVSASIPATATAGASLTAQIVLTNDGWAVPSRNRPVNLVLDNGAGVTAVFPAAVDLRTIDAGQNVTATITFTAPAAGTYSTYLTLPDPSSSIAARPEYALRLANTGLWDAATGRHALNLPLTVSGSGGSSGGGGTTPPVTSGQLKAVSKLRIAGNMRVVKLVK